MCGSEPARRWARSPSRATAEETPTTWSWAPVRDGSTSTARWAAFAWRCSNVARTPTRRPPTSCPVCSHRLAVTRLSCPSCETELSGGFASCEFCVLADEDREVLRIFLASRGNMKDLERHLGVSYPTARARFDLLLTKLGIERAPAAAPSRIELMEQVARGEIDVDEALRRLESTREA